MSYDSYEDWYDNGPGSEKFKRQIREEKIPAVNPFVMKSEYDRVVKELEEAQLEIDLLTTK
jgi:flagellar assembly factor FliW